jgi:hypothetical protein
VVEKHGDDPKDDQKLRPITCFMEGAIHNILLHYDDAQNVCFLLTEISYFIFDIVL